ncbi:MAG: hypothetical protein IKP65_01280 [Alphaproteobacteria bacterium]|nr:hypothetical protein [Alphaproteobacteria bacterium]
MEKEDKCLDFVTGKTKEVCAFCSFFENDMNDPQKVGGTCKKDDEFCFCYEYCDKYNKKEK